MTKKPRRKWRGRVEIDILRRAVLYRQTMIQQQNLVGDGKRLVVVMRDIDQRDVLMVSDAADLTSEPPFSSGDRAHQAAHQA